MSAPRDEQQADQPLDDVRESELRESELRSDDKSNELRHRIEGHDGWLLDVLDLSPEGQPRGVVVLGHAMMVDRRTVYRPDRPSLATTLRDRGLRVLVPDLRGHGASGPSASEGGVWRYDDLVLDTAPLIRLARQTEPSAPVFLIGHSLFGHSALAFLGQNPKVEVSGVVALSVNLWIGQWESRAHRWWAKRSAILASGLIARAFGYLPAARLGFGTCDESLEYWRDFERWVRTGRWTSCDGRDYREGLRRVSAPVLQVMSDGDHWMGGPTEGTRFLASLPSHAVLRVGPHCHRAELRQLAPDHMGMVTRASSEPIWQAIADWVVSIV